MEKSLLRQQYLLSVCHNFNRGRHREKTKYLHEPCLTCRKQSLLPLQVAFPAPRFCAFQYDPASLGWPVEALSSSFLD